MYVAIIMLFASNEYIIPMDIPLEVCIEGYPTH